ncbi:MAG: HD domain-containing protein [Deltaproteobacteria bacterium]|nr:HD domain-containing protein [Deltaproteobacteria bacterium]
MGAKANKPLILRDEIHGDMNFDPILKRIVDHESFQRLRHIKQLGLAEYVFPCATHTRFQHSLGACYLAGQYYRSLLKAWQGSSLQQLETGSENTQLFAHKTWECVRAVSSDIRSRDYWAVVAMSAGLLHDVGHGPWSHTFETLGLKLDFDNLIMEMKGAVASYFSELKRTGACFKHEDLSVLYLFHIFRTLAAEDPMPDYENYFLPVALLIHPKLLRGPHAPNAEGELEIVLKKSCVKGGVDFHRLLRPIISGPFDVDRMDYIQRDGRNCGVFIGGIEWRRIVRKLIPCLAHHENNRNEPSDVVLLSNVKNQHVLDDFIFSLFQMYTQVYLHPKIVGLEEAIRMELSRNVRQLSKLTVTFEIHKNLTDEGFREILCKDLGICSVDDILLRRPARDFKVASFASDARMESELAKQNFEKVKVELRPMMKDSVGVFLFQSIESQSGAKLHSLKPWVAVSPVARQFYEIEYSPEIWIRTSS